LPCFRLDDPTLGDDPPPLCAEDECEVDEKLLDAHVTRCANGKLIIGPPPGPTAFRGREGSTWRGKNINKTCDYIFLMGW
jgi:hypothetical protein